MALERSKRPAVKGRGRRKIEMKMIENRSSRDTSFSKRCRGLFKKSGELAVLTDVKIAVVVFSPAGRPFSFGHPAPRDLVHLYIESFAPIGTNIEANAALLGGGVEVEELTRKRAALVALRQAVWARLIR